MGEWSIILAVLPRIGTIIITDYVANVISIETSSWRLMSSNRLTNKLIFVLKCTGYFEYLGFEPKIFTRF